MNRLQYLKQEEVKWEHNTKQCWTDYGSKRLNYTRARIDELEIAEFTLNEILNELSQSAREEFERVRMKYSQQAPKPSNSVPSDTPDNGTKPADTILTIDKEVLKELGLSEDK